MQLMIHHRSGSFGVRDIKEPRVGFAGKTEAQQLAHVRARTVAAGEVRGFTRVLAAVRILQTRDDMVAAVFESHELKGSLNFNAELTQQLAAVATAYEQIEISDANVAAATEALRVTQERYRLGAGTLLDLLTSQANITQAEVNQVQARFTYLIARAQAEALVGHTL